MVPAKAAAICPALRDFPSDPSPLGVETGGVAGLRRGFPKSENAGRGRKMPFMDGHELGRARSGHAVGELFGFVGGNLQHPLAAAVKVPLAALQDGDDAAAIRTFMDIGFLGHDGPPWVSVGPGDRADVCDVKVSG